jgi:predicted aspartyl protease
LRSKFSSCPILFGETLEGPAGSIESVLVLDTGASITVISRRVLRVIGYDASTTSTSLTLTTAEGNVRVPTLQIQALEFKEFRRERVMIAAHDLPANAKVDGLLGTDLLAGLVVKIDFAEGELEIVAATTR